MRRVQLLVGGTQKSGTTTLHHLISQLEGLVPPPDKKELHFFDDESVDWTAPDYGPLHDPFEGWQTDAIWYESTPITLYWPPCLERVRAYNPDMKFIFIFRDPVHRAYSHWAMQWLRGWEDLPFSAAVAAEDERLAAAAFPADAAWRRKSYLRRGLYGRQLERALRMFDREQMLLLRFDDLVADPGTVLQKVADFTGTAMPDAPNLALHVNGRPNTRLPSALTEADIAFLSERLREDTARFAALSGLDVSGWLPLRSA